MSMEGGRVAQCVEMPQLNRRPWTTLAGRRVVKPGVALQEVRELCANKGLGR